MRILLICEHGDYRFSSWKRLESVLSAGHEAIRVARVVRDRSASDTSDDVMSAAEFQSFAPDLLAMSGEPDARVPLANPFGVKPERRVPWELEQEFRAAGGAIFFFQAEGALNTWEVNPGYAEYGLPLATSVERGVNVYAGRYGTLDVVFSDWVPPAGLPGAGTGAGGPLREVVVHSPWVLDAAMAEFHPLLLTDCDVKDPVWVHEGGLTNGVSKPYPVAAWTQDPAPVVLVTGDAFSDEGIGNGQNEELLRILVTALSRLRPKSGRRVRQPAPGGRGRDGSRAGRADDGGPDGLHARVPGCRPGGQEAGGRGEDDSGGCHEHRGPARLPGGRAVAAGSQLSVSQAGTAVYYTGSNGQLMNAYYESGWHIGPLGGAVRAGSPIITNPNPNGTNVFFIDTGNRVSNAYHNSSGWHIGTIGGSVG